MYALFIVTIIPVVVAGLYIFDRSSVREGVAYIQDNFGEYVPGRTFEYER